MSRFGKNLMKMPAALRNYVGVMYTRATMNQHTLAFLQWRYRKSKDESLPKQISTIKTFMLLVEKGLSAQMAEYRRASPAAGMQLKIPLDELTMRDYYTEKPGCHAHMIDSMAMLGFPEFLKKSEKQSEIEETTFLTNTQQNDPKIDRQSPDYQAYPDYKMDSINSPNQLYIPTERVLIQLMRAACYIQKREDFVYRPPLHWQLVPAYIVAANSPAEIGSMASHGFLED